MANESLGVVSCEGCNGAANVKRKATGKKLLYLHCKSCGMDARSGKALQERWQVAIDGGSVESETELSNEWKPMSGDIENEESNSSESDDNSRASNSKFKWLAGIGIAAAILIGIQPK